jgi:hypothetical protein
MGTGKGSMVRGRHFNMTETKNQRIRWGSRRGDEKHVVRITSWHRVPGMRWTRCPIWAGVQERGWTHGQGITSLEQRCSRGSALEELEDIVLTQGIRISDLLAAAQRALVKSHMCRGEKVSAKLK